MVWGAGGPWSDAGPWGVGVVYQPTTQVLRPGFNHVEPNRVLVDTVGFLLAEVDRPGAWDATLTHNRKPILIPEEHVRRVNFTERDIITLRTDYSNLEPVSTGYEYRNEEQSLVFTLFTRISRDHMLKLTQELERVLHGIRKDTFGDLDGDTGRTWLKVVERTHAEYTTRRYWMRQVRVHIIRRFMKLDQS